MIAKADRPQDELKGKMADRLRISVDKYIQGMYIDNTPKYSWLQAIKDAGYTHKYAHGHCSELWKRAKHLIDARVDELKENWSYTLEWIDQQFRDQYAECGTKGDRTNAIRCLEDLTKRKAGFTDVIASTKADQPSPLTDEDVARLKADARSLINQGLRASSGPLNKETA